MIKISKKEWKEINESYAAFRESQKDRDWYCEKRQLWPEKFEEAKAAEQKAKLNFWEKSEKLKAWIDDVEKRCGVRKCSTKEMFSLLFDYFKKCDIHKKDMHGVEIYINSNSEKFPGTYKGIPQSTCFTAVYDKSVGWIITDIFRNDARYNTIHSVTYTPEFRIAILKNFIPGYYEKAVKE